MLYFEREGGVLEPSASYFTEGSYICSRDVVNTAIKLVTNRGKGFVTPDLHIETQLPPARIKVHVILSGSLSLGGHVGKRTPFNQPM